MTQFGFRTVTPGGTLSTISKFSILHVANRNRAPSGREFKARVTSPATLRPGGASVRIRVTEADAEIVHVRLRCLKGCDRIRDLHLGRPLTRAGCGDRKGHILQEFVEL